MPKNKNIFKTFALRHLYSFKALFFCAQLHQETIFSQNTNTNTEDKLHEPINQNIFTNSNLPQTLTGSLETIQKLHNPENEKVAVCIEGPSTRLKSETLQQIKGNVLAPLNADAFVVVSVPGLDESTSHAEVEQQIQNVLDEGLGRDVVTSSAIKEDVSFHVMVNWFFRTVKNPQWWVDVWSLFIKRTRCPYTNPDDMLTKCFPERTDGMPEKSSNSSKIDRGLWNLYTKRFCYDLIVEQEKRNNRFYDRVIYIRNDLYFLMPHPPLNVMDNDYVWIPETSDWTGYNDRHAVLPRKHMHTYFARLDMILNGQMEQYMRFTNYWQQGKRLSMELTILLAFNGFHGLQDEIKVGRFLPIAALLCASEGYSTQARSCYNQFKYEEEFSVAHRTFAFWTRNFYWHRTTRHKSGSRTFNRKGGVSQQFPNFEFKGNMNACFDYSPDEFSEGSSHDLFEEMCCNQQCRTHPQTGELQCSFGGNLNCFEHQLFHFDVCCLKSEQLTMQPNPNLEQEILEEFVEENTGLFWKESRIDKNERELCHWLDWKSNLMDCVDILTWNERKKFYDENYFLRIGSD